jgi:hypothetical protein
MQLRRSNPQFIDKANKFLYFYCVIVVRKVAGNRTREVVPSGSCCIEDEL